MGTSVPARLRRWPRDPDELERLQRELAELEPDPWRFGRSHPPVVGAVFVASGTSRGLAVASGIGGKESSGHPTRPEQLWAAAVVTGRGDRVHEAVVRSSTPSPYRSGYLALRHGPAIEAAVRALPVLPDVLLVDATGRDHPRGAGLSLHVGAVLDLPTIGVTDRPLVATADEPGDERGSRTALVLEGREVGAAVRIRSRARAVIVHAGWRTDAATARHLVMTLLGPSRTPEPLRRARFLARVARAEDEGRLPPAFRPAYR